MFSILRVFLMFLFFSLSSSVFPAIFRSILISIVSNNHFVFVVSGLVSAVYAIIGLIVVLEIVDFASRLRCLFLQIILL